MIKFGFWFSLGMQIPLRAYKLKDGLNSYQDIEIIEYKEISMRSFGVNTLQGIY